MIYISFSEICYTTLGAERLTHNFITQELDQKSPIVLILQGVYSVNLVCSYAIMIAPANTILEDWILRPCTRRAN